jgi:hypothetical protein
MQPPLRRAAYHQSSRAQAVHQMFRADASEEEVCLTRKSSRRCDGLAQYRRNLLVRQLFMRRLEQHGPDGSATSLARTRLEQKMAADPRTIRGSPIADQSEGPASIPASAAGANMVSVLAVPYEGLHGLRARAARPCSRVCEMNPVLEIRACTERVAAAY